MTCLQFNAQLRCDSHENENVNLGDLQNLHYHIHQTQLAHINVGVLKHAATAHIHSFLPHTASTISQNREEFSI